MEKPLVEFHNQFLSNIKHVGIKDMQNAAILFAKLDYMYKLLRRP